MSRHFLTAELDEIASQVEKINPRLAAKLDTVANTLDRVAEANYDIPDWEAADEAGHQDAYKADSSQYHKFPVGKDSLSKMLGKASPADWNPEPAEEGRVELQASAKNWPFEDLTPAGLARLASKGRWDEVARAARLAMEEDVPDPDGDPGDPTDTYSTAGLPEAGGDAANDDDQEGTELQFFGTVPAGELHMPGGGRKKSTDPSSLLNSGRDPVTAGLSQAALRARRILEAADQVVAETQKVDPSKEGRGPGEEVERDQSLGGMGKDTGPDPDPRMASKKVTVQYPKGMPIHQASAWERAAKRVQRQGKLLTAAKKVNYSAIEAEFKSIVKSSN